MLKPIWQIIAFISITSLSGYLFYINNLNTILGILLGASLQYVFNFIFISVLNSIIAIKNKKLENERIKEFTLQGLEVECPCSRKIKDFVPIILNTQNKYKCKECQKLISVYVTPSTALTTEPIINTDITSPSILN